MFAAFNKSIVSADEIPSFVPDHLEYMLRLQNDGILFVSGPFIKPGVIVGEGLTILRAANLEQAKHYIDEEPLINANFTVMKSGNGNYAKVALMYPWIIEQENIRLHS